MNDQPTPGPHIAYKIDDNSPLVQAGCWGVEGGGDTICYLWRLDEETHDVTPFENDEANAHLFAAASDMKALLREWMRWLQFSSCVPGTEDCPSLRKATTELLAKLDGEADA